MHQQGILTLDSTIYHKAAKQTQALLSLYLKYAKNFININS